MAPRPLEGARERALVMSIGSSSVEGAALEVRAISKISSRSSWESRKRGQACWTFIPLVWREEEDMVVVEESRELFSCSLVWF